MTQTESNWQTHVFGILPHSAEPRILMWPAETGCVLPGFLFHERRQWVGAGFIKKEMQTVLGIEINVLQRVYYREDQDKRRAEAIYILESDTPLAVAGARWIGREGLAGLSLPWPAHRPLIEKHLLEAEGSPIPEQRPPWARPGWYAAATSWIQEQLTQSGRTLLAPVEPVRSWSLSCVLRAQTDAGRFYFKAGPDWPLFVNEAALLAQLAPRYPGYIPEPLKVDRPRRWMLLADFGQPIAEKASLAERETMVCTIGQIQRETAADVDALLAMGCVNRRLGVLITQIEPLFNDSEAITGLDENEIEQLKELIPQLKTRCEQLADYGVPPTLVHGDLHTGNVTFVEGKPLFFDWTDACVTHPFFDVMLSIGWEPDIALQSRLRDRYLPLWTSFESMERLQKIWSLAQPLFALHHAVSYQHIVACMEDTAKHELIAVTSNWLRRILNYMPDRANDNRRSSE